MRTRSKLLVLSFCLVCLSCIRLSAQEGGKTLFSLPPFERAIICIIHFEGLHTWKDYPYVGYGHRYPNFNIILTFYCKYLKYNG